LIREGLGGAMATKCRDVGPSQRFRMWLVREALGYLRAAIDVGGDGTELDEGDVVAATDDSGGQPPEAPAPSPEAVAALCADIESSAREYGDDCKALGKRILRKSHQNDLGLAELVDAASSSLAACR